MSKPKQIAWESWNARVDEIMMAENLFQPQKEEEASFMDAELPQRYFLRNFLCNNQRFFTRPWGYIRMSLR